MPLLDPAVDMNTLGPCCVLLLLLLAASAPSLSICCFTRSCQDLRQAQNRSTHAGTHTQCSEHVMHQGNCTQE